MIEVDYKPTYTQILAHLAKEKHILFGGAVAGGKLCDLSTLILTSQGFKIMGDIKIGDQVFDEDGDICNVIWCSEIDIEEDTYEITFDTNEKIIVGGNHEWATLTVSERSQNRRLTPEFRTKRRIYRPYRGKGKRPDLAIDNSLKQYNYKEPIYGKVRTTKEIYDTQTYLNRQHNHAIYIAKAINFPKKVWEFGRDNELGIPPYVLGAWLGDGTSLSGQITGIDIPIFDEIRKCGFIVTNNKSPKSHHILNLVSLLRCEDLINNKHIPNKYMFASFKDRLALLQGMLDTDGYINSKGQVELCLANKPLLKQFLDLIRSLGIKCSQIRSGESSCNGKKFARYRIKFITNLPVFKLPRKREKIPKTINERCKFHYITKVEKIPNRHKKCIQVDSPNHLFLCGNSLIPTHNSTWLVMDALRQCLGWRKNRVGIFRYRNSNFKDTTGVTLKTWIIDTPGLVKQHHLQNRIITLFNDSQIVYGGIQPADRATGDALSMIKSLEVNALYFDEANDIPEDVYTFSCTRVPRIKCINERTKQREYPPPRIAITSNPHLGWIKFRFIDQNIPDHKFIPSKLIDNPHTAKGYLKQLISSFKGKEDWIRCFIEGDWSAVEEFDNVYKTDWLNRAIKNKIERSSPVVLGVDVGGGGRDKTVVILREGMHSSIIFAERSFPDTMSTVYILEKLIEKYRPSAINIDSVGVAQGVCDRLIELGYPIVAINGGASPIDKRFANKRAELYWGVRNLLERNEMNLPIGEELLNELGCIKYVYSSQDKNIAIEMKVDLRKRLGHSPDFADALVYAYADTGFSYETSALVGADS